MSLQTKSRWYVYELIDPRTSTVFYVGKGKGDRMFAHEKEADRGVCSKKTSKINEIRNSGNDICRSQVAFFWDEQAAYDHETDRIDEIGLENLTNILPGGQKAWERRRTERMNRQEELNAVQYAKLIREAKNISCWFVKYVEAFEGGVKELSVSGHKLHLMIAGALFEVFYPKAWQKIKASSDALRIVEPVFERHGVKLVYGCA